VSIGRREDLLVLVASLYYEQDYSQQEIADRLQKTRSNISRLLKEAKEKGVVEIRIRKPIATAPALERELKERFKLQHATVVESSRNDYAADLAAVGRLAARYIEEILQPHDVLAIAWGTGVSAAVEGFDASQTLHVEVVQMLGSVGTVDSVIDGPEIARRLAMKLGGKYYYLHAPLFVDSQTVRNMLLSEPTIADTLNRARKSNVAIVGIGTTEPGASSFLRAGHLTEAQVADLRSQGVVGETAGQHFDIDGNSASYDLNQRVITLTLDDIKRIPHVIGVACGLHKKCGILGALRGKLIKAIATDDTTAAAVLAEADKHP
jgi:deoxyribonucleoside regulator